MKTLGLAIRASALAAAAVLAGAAPRASAQARPRGTADSALELRLSSGYEQAFGDIGYGLPSLGQYGGPGGALELHVAWRAAPAFSVGVFAAGGRHARGEALPEGARLFGVAAGAQAELHIAPGARWDPWVALGAALRRHLIERARGSESYDGHELLRLRLGLDRRLGGRSTLGPVVAVALTRFSRHALPGGGAEDVQSPSLGLFAFAGLSATLGL